MKNEEINIPLASVVLIGNLTIPKNAKGLVVFSHGSGSGRLSSRNILVAKMIQEHGFGTLLFDLLTEVEDRDYENRFDIDLLSSRLIKTTDWLMINKETKNYPIAYFGASTGAASAIRAAAYFGEKINAVVSRGGRPDLALNVIHLVTAPTLLLVGQLDSSVIEMNKKAFDLLISEKEMKIIPGATHLFEEPGKLIEVADFAISWYEKFLNKKQTTSRQSPSKKQ